MFPSQLLGKQGNMMNSWVILRPELFFLLLQFLARVLAVYMQFLDSPGKCALVGKDVIDGIT